jgi:hypothetical protein
LKKSGSSQSLASQIFSAASADAAILVAVIQGTPAQVRHGWAQLAGRPS